MDVTIVDRLDDVDPADLERLDRSAGAAGSHGRQQQWEADGRWHCRWLRAVERGQLVAAVPVYVARGGWPDPAYDPSGWGLPPEAGDDLAAASCLLLGGCGDLRSGLPVAPSHRDPATLRALLAPLARLAVDEGRQLVLPYAYPVAREALDRAMGHAVHWAPLCREAQLRGVSRPDWEEAQRKPVRYNLRHDRRLVAAAGVEVTTGPWSAVEGPAGELIAAHNQRKGRTDHPEFVRMRHRQWDACPGVELLVFTARAAGVQGFVTGWVWRDQLEIYEIGLAGAAGPERLATYVDLVFHQPLRLARERGLDTVRLGPAAERIKAGRGALFEDLYGGVLDGRDTKRLAND